MDIRYNEKTFRTFRKMKESFDYGMIHGHKVFIMTSIPTHNIKYCFGSFITPNPFAEYVFSGALGSQHCNEILRENTFVYFDLEGAKTNEPLFRKTFNEMLLESYSELGIPLSQEQILWSTTIHEDKSSFHVVIKNGYSVPNDKRYILRHLVYYLENKCIQRFPILTYIKNENNCFKTLSYFDHLVYTKNRCFRCIKSTKVQIPFKFLNPVDKKAQISDIPIHLITAYGNLKEFIISEIPKKLYSIDKTLIENIVNQMGLKIRGYNKNIITLQNQGPRHCIFGPVHKSNNSYLEIDYIKNNIIFHCHSGKCKGKSKVVSKISENKNIYYYSDYKKVILQLLNIPLAERYYEKCKNVITEYLINCFSLIDKKKPEYAYKKLKTEIGLEIPCQVYELSSDVFSGISDIKIKCIQPFSGGNKQTEISFSKILNELSIRRKLKTYSNVTFYPYNRLKETYQETNELNLFTGFYFDHGETHNFDFTKSRCYQLITEGLCSGNVEVYTHLLKTIAMKIQYPNRKVDICISFLNSAEGTGKGHFSIFLKRLFRAHHILECSNENDILGRFNSSHMNKLFLILEELGSDTNCYKLSNQLKALIAREKIDIERKGCDILENIPCFDQLIIYSNSIYGTCKISNTDRRFFLPTPSSKFKNNFTFFKELRTQELNNKAFMHKVFLYFTNLDISEFQFRSFPDTDLRRIQKLNSIELPVRFMIYLLQSFENWNILQNAVSITRIQNKIKSLTLSKKNCYKLFIDFREKCGCKKNLEASYLWNRIRIIFPEIEHLLFNRKKSLRINLEPTVTRIQTYHKEYTSNLNDSELDLYHYIEY